jgi:hypothetical protein
MQACEAGYALSYATTLTLQLRQLNGRRPDCRQVQASYNS